LTDIGILYNPVSQYTKNLSSIHPDRSQIDPPVFPNRWSSVAIVEKEEELEKGH